MKTRTLLSAAGYAKAPKTTFFLKHPWKALTGWLAFRTIRKSVTGKAGRAAVAAGAVAATAAVAAPFAIKAVKGKAKPEGTPKKARKPNA
jgi:hypothetical protein